MNRLLREWVAVRHRATFVAATAVLGLWIALNIVGELIDPSSSGRPVLRAVQAISYPSSLMIGAVISGCALLFVIWATRKRDARSWLPLAIVLLALGPTVMVVQDVMVTAALPGAAPPITLDAFSGLLYSMVTTTLGLLLALLIARLALRPANKRIEQNARR